MFRNKMLHKVKKFEAKVLSGLRVITKKLEEEAKLPLTAHNKVR